MEKRGKTPHLGEVNVFVKSPIRRTIVVLAAVIMQTRHLCLSSLFLRAFVLCFSKMISCKVSTINSYKFKFVLITQCLLEFLKLR